MIIYAYQSSVVTGIEWSPTPEPSTLIPIRIKVDSHMSDESTPNRTACDELGRKRRLSTSTGIGETAVRTCGHRPNRSTGLDERGVA